MPRASFQGVKKVHVKSIANQYFEKLAAWHAIQATYKTYKSSCTYKRFLFSFSLSLAWQCCALKIEARQQTCCSECFYLASFPRTTYAQNTRNRGEPSRGGGQKVPPVAYVIITHWLNYACGVAMASFYPPFPRFVQQQAAPSTEIDKAVQPDDCRSEIYLRLFILIELHGLGGLLTAGDVTSRFCVILGYFWLCANNRSARTHLRSLILHLINRHQINQKFTFFILDRC